MSAVVDRAQARPGASELVTATLAGQEIAMPVTAVQDVLGPQSLTPVPRSRWFFYQTKCPRNPTRSAFHSSEASK